MRCLLLVALAACGDSSMTLPFAKLDDNSVDRLVLAALGGDVGGAISRVTRIQHTATCPHVDIEGTTVTLTGGCLTDTEQFEGVARISNHWASVNGQDARYELEHFTITNLRTGARELFDGLVVGVQGPTERFDADLYVGFDARLVKSELHKRCDVDTCRTEGTVELVDVGLASVSGRVGRMKVDDFEATLRGVERVELTAELTGLNVCPVWRIVGTDRVRTMACAR